MPADAARIEARALLGHALGGVSHAWLLGHAAETLDASQAVCADRLLARRLAGEPVAYLLGHREFFGLDFLVTPDVLIPRPDTETLVETALRRIPAAQPCRVLDLGTGSGAVAVALAHARPLAAVTAVERSAAALAVARANAGRIVGGALELLQSDWFSALGGRQFDVIVGNPPYIAAADPHLRQGDLRFEPGPALVAGEDGLDDLRTIIRAAPAHLAPGGWLLLEHGHEQAAAVAGLLRQAGLDATGHVADLAGILRVTLGRR